MATEKKEITFNTSARIMVLLGQQLITDEITAISEIIKNSYDADATKVIIKLINVTDKHKGIIQITDNGNGMNRENLISAWFNVGTYYKSRKDENPRYSEIFKRPYLGEKGIGRFAIHKLGITNEIITRGRNSNHEYRFYIDWSKFEDTSKLLSQIPIIFEERNPVVFNNSSLYNFNHGFQITISKLHMAWNSKRITDLRRYIWSINTPHVKLNNFDVDISIEDPNYKDVYIERNYEEILQTSPYYFEADIDEKGMVQINYSFRSKVKPRIKRKLNYKIDAKDPGDFPSESTPICGPFKFVIYCWDLDQADKRAAFSDIHDYERYVKPFRGVRLFRDNFRVLPYGNEDNDWLGLDLRRVKRFSDNVSRNQIIGIIQITSKDNPNLKDKSDREGLIDDEFFQDFKKLIDRVLTEFNNLRRVDRRKIKNKPKFDLFKARTLLQNIEKTVDEASVSNEIKQKISREIELSSRSFEKISREKEEPLLVASSIGLGLMIPIHELRRLLMYGSKEAKEIKNLEVSNKISELINSLIEHIQEARNIVDSIAKLSERIKEKEIFGIEEIINNTLALLKFKLERSNVTITTDKKVKFNVEGSSRLISTMLINLIDNSTYWLQKNKIDDRKIKIILDTYSDDFNILIISDNGPGINYQLEEIILPFFTTKPDGMGLGLYICDRIARMHNASLKLLDQTEDSGLLKGANIGIIFPVVK